ncbi:uncharacterized protein VDAG_04111 [Verticillium dahliae VdLs.17]|uniref:Uncharacterized protein n=1 Tax=Verticillium dahliae (strain VdLs.17 / ATCC MYA-4575 / FGSC 10137) TaxID=498257 RepID=G2X2R7_VERDV|nr:uncharacterized protein VDAG_04111 [Verticillium dahliae VdLs.17]EGY22673.1 hypothetical protein VDAG_04111 [Verticillium dahliae VdLs.17]
MDANPQTQSAFITTLPREVRDAIYLELWRSSGLRQHILFHSYESDCNARHFCRWACTTDFCVESPLQQDIEQLRRDLDVPLGEDIEKNRDPRSTLYGRRMQSPWLNHWACGERAEKAHGARRRCTSADTPASSSAECLRSIYESTTFVFTDMKTVQMWFGYCALPPFMQAWPKRGLTPPAFYKYARTFELSLFPTFPLDLLCATKDLPGLAMRHAVYDFHWLRLDRFEHLTNVNIWIDSRSLMPLPEDALNFSGIKHFSRETLHEALACFSSVPSVTISTALGPGIGPEDDGRVEDIAPPGVTLFKRGLGDRFHPYLNAIMPGKPLDGLIHTCVQREVRLATEGGGIKLD